LLVETVEQIHLVWNMASGFSATTFLVSLWSLKMISYLASFLFIIINRIS
jgi:hypothetical protein